MVRIVQELLRWEDLVVTVAGPTDGDEWTFAQRAELELFAVGNGWATEEDLAAGEVLAYRRFDSRSEIFLARLADDLDQVVGVSRMIWGTCGQRVEDSFMTPTVHELDREWRWFLDHIGTARMAEWGSLGASRNDGTPLLALWSAIYRVSRARGVDYWIQSVTRTVFLGLRRRFRLPLVRIGEDALVVGAMSRPTMLFLEEMAAGPTLSWDPELKRRLLAGWVERSRRVADDMVVDLADRIDLTEPAARPAAAALAEPIDLTARTARAEAARTPVAGPMAATGT